MDFDGKLALQFAVSQNFNSLFPPIRDAGITQRRFIDGGTVFEIVERFQVDRDVANRETLVVETALGNAANQRHLAAFKSDADRTAGAGGLAFSTATAGFAVAAGFTLAEPFASMLGSGTGFKIV